MKGYSLGIFVMEKQNFSSLMYSCDHVYLLFFVTVTLKCLFHVLEKMSSNFLCLYWDIWCTRESGNKMTFTIFCFQ